MPTPKIRYRKGYKYQLDIPYVAYVGICPTKVAATDYLELDMDGYLFIKDGYAWDGPSGPTIDTPDSLRASLEHDAMYQLMRLGELDRSFRKAVDKRFYTVLKEDGMGWFRRFMWYRAVSRFAGKFVEPESIQEVYTAP